MKRIVCIYNANGGIKGELKYIFGKLLGTTKCSLCDITHGLSIKPKKEWTTLVEKFPIKIETVHINEMDDETKKIYDNKTPEVIYLDGNKSKILINKNELENCNKSIEEFFKLLNKKLKEYGLDKVVNQ